MGQNRPRRAQKPASKQGFSAFARVLAVLALAIQCLVIQTHIDPPAQAAQLSIAHEASLTVGHKSDQKQHRQGGDCVICQAAAVARTSLVAPTVAVPLIERAEVPVALITTAEHAPLIEAHAWQSRAPPSQL